MVRTQLRRLNPALRAGAGAGAGMFDVRHCVAIINVVIFHDISNSSYLLLLSLLLQADGGRGLPSGGQSRDQWRPDCSLALTCPPPPSLLPATAARPALPHRGCRCRQGGRVAWPGLARPGTLQHRHIGDRRPDSPHSRTQFSVERERERERESSPGLFSVRVVSNKW